MRWIRAVGRRLNSAIRWALGIYLVSTFGFMLVYVLLGIPPSDLPAALAHPMLAVILVIAALTVPIWLIVLVSLLLREKSDAGEQRAAHEKATLRDRDQVQGDDAHAGALLVRLDAASRMKVSRKRTAIP